MSTFHYSSYKKLLLVVVLAYATLLAGGCVDQRVQQQAPPSNNTQSNSNLTANINAQPSPNATEEKAAAAVLTLPLLDALLADEEFVNEAKSTIQLTDAELQKLRDTARNAVLKLSDNPSDNEPRSTKAATADAKKELQQVLGADRAGRFVQLVDKHGGGEKLANAKPNQVPTDTRVVVNAPAYRMDIFDNGKLVQSYKVGIGYPEFPLPIGLRSAKSIIINPTWTPPDEPWVKGNVAPGRTVQAGEKLNPLGPIKIPIGLPNLIHGGKSASRLGTFASHGCVGLTNPLIEDFAAKIAAVGGERLSQQDIKSYEKSKTETKEIKLDHPIPVELRYETIVVENGTLKIYRDVYEKGTNTEDNLKEVLQTFGVAFDELQPDVQKQLLAGIEQMAVDATGSPVHDNDNSKQAKDKSGLKSQSARVTRDVKGKKVVEFQLPQLAGKGYPAPVGMK